MLWVWESVIREKLPLPGTDQQGNRWDRQLSGSARELLISVKEWNGQDRQKQSEAARVLICLLIFRHPRLPGSLKMWKEQRRKQIQEISVMEQLTPGLFIN